MYLSPIHMQTDNCSMVKYCISLYTCTGICIYIHVNQNACLPWYMVLITRKNRLNGLLQICSSVPTFRNDIFHVLSHDMKVSVFVAVSTLFQFGLSVLPFYVKFWFECCRYGMFDSFLFLLHTVTRVISSDYSSSVETNICKYRKWANTTFMLWYHLHTNVSSPRFEISTQVDTSSSMIMMTSLKSGLEH